ncbi:Xylosyltransferase sqv-6, partial [Trichostrongylus colubriformis]
MRMRERSSTSLRTAASAAIAPHRIPLFRTMYIVAGTILFFFLNLYFIYMYVQNQTDDALEETVELQEPLQPQPLHPGAPLPVSSLYSCNITDPLALSALARVKTESCMKKITDAACRLKNGAFHDRFPESQCGNHDSLLIDLHVGCFEDHKSNRTLNGFSYDFKDDNSAAKCRSFCYRAGFVYYGLEFGRECFCGDSVSSKPLSQTKCSTYKCSGNDSQFCGGFNAIDVFHTGLKRAHLMPKAVFESDSYVRTKRPRILFLLQLNGRNERQVKRLLKALYSPYHYYYIHVDQRQLYMLTEMKAVAAKVANVFVAPDAHSTIWGGASLLTMVQDTIRQSIALPSISDWDYLVNLSESDFPVMTLQEFETQLHANLGKSYMSSHGYNAARFIQKQGFDFVFVECENRMWRIGKRDEFPRNLRIDGGSDWIVLHREFAEYSISDEDLPTKLRALFSSIILPVESFFHTLSYNSRFCERSIGSNLRLTNWNRKQ